MYLSVLRETPLEADLVASWRRGPDDTVSKPAGTAQIGGRAGDVWFAITPATLTGETVIGSEPITNPPPVWALRVDEVAFPVGAIAHRHVHTGSGWRHLVSGALRIETDEDATVMEPGMSWFEPAGSPVRAVALQTAGITRFVRCMIIPIDYADRSTFQLCDQKDASLPRLQMTHRHIDHIP